MKPSNFRVLAIKMNSAQQLWSERSVPRPIQGDLIFLVHLETGVGETLR
jgi:hypothetical protein